MRTKLGLIFVSLGAMMGDSECLVIPLIVIAIGIALVKAGKRRGEQDEEL